MDTREGKEEGTQGMKEEATLGTQEGQHLEVKTGMGEEGKSFQDQEAEENHGIEGTAKIEGADNQGEALIGRGGEPDIPVTGREADQVIQKREEEIEMEETKEEDSGAIVEMEEASPEVLQSIAMEEEHCYESKLLAPGQCRTPPFTERNIYPVKHASHSTK